MHPHQDHSHPQHTRKAVGWIAVATAVILMGSTVPTPLYDVYRRELGFSELTLTLVYATYAAGNLAALLLLGRLSDQVGRRPTAFAALGVAVVSTLCFVCITGTGWLFVARAISGAAIGLFSGAAAAWVADLMPGDDHTRASVVIATANYAGLTAGPIAAGILAQYVPGPLRVSYFVLLGLTAAAFLLVRRSAETVASPRPWREVSLKPRIGVPRDIRVEFVSPALTAFATFALIGFYAALAPSVLEKKLHVLNKAASGAIVAELFLVGTVAVVASKRMAARAAMLGSLGLLLVTLVTLVIAYVTRSLPILLGGTALTGISAAVGYRGSLDLVTGMAPSDRRAEVISTYFVVGYVGNAVPIIGVGVLTQRCGPEVANLVLTITVAVLAVIALIMGAVAKPRK